MHKFSLGWAFLSFGKTVVQLTKFFLGPYNPPKFGFINDSQLIHWSRLHIKESNECNQVCVVDNCVEFEGKIFTSCAGFFDDFFCKHDSLNVTWRSEVAVLQVFFADFAIIVLLFLISRFKYRIIQRALWSKAFVFYSLCTYHVKDGCSFVLCEKKNNDEAMTCSTLIKVLRGRMNSMALTFILNI